MASAVPGPKSRPAVVTAAGVVLFLLVAVRLAAAFAFGHSIAPNIGFFAVDLHSSSAPFVLGLDIFLVAIGLFVLLVMLGYAPLAALVLRGNQTARILTWTFAGIEIIYDVGALHVLPPVVFWEERVVIDATVATLIGQTISAALLALPPANMYFRKAPRQG
jgi:hypothetical protein